MVEETLFTLDQDGSVLIIVLPNEPITFADEVVQEQAQTVVEQLAELDVSHLIFDFGQCPYFASILIAQIVRFYRVIDARNAQFAICNLSKEARMILEISNLLSLWKVFDSREEALASSCGNRLARYERCGFRGRWAQTSSESDQSCPAASRRYENYR